MKTRITTHLEWVPTLGCNNNMLAYVTKSEKHSFWLHRVTISHLEGTQYAVLTMAVFYAPRYEPDLDFFKHFKVLPQRHAGLEGDIQERVTGLVAATRIIPTLGKYEEFFYFNVPLRGTPFTERAMKVVQLLDERITPCSHRLWLYQLRSFQTSEVRFKRVWVRFGDYLLFKNNLKSESDLTDAN